MSATAFRPNRSRVAWQTVGGRTVLVDLHGSRVLGLNEVGTAAWALLEEHDVDAAAAAVARRFDVGVVEAERDLRRFVEELAARGYLTET